MEIILLLELIWEDSNSTTNAGNNSMTSAGAAYIYERDPTTGWPTTESIYLKASAPVANGRFGCTVAMTEDYIIIGETGRSGGGAAYIFERDPTTGWPATPTKQITAGVTGGNFGISVAVDGNKIVVGNQSSNIGYIFERDSTTGWPATPTRSININNAIGSESFGIAVGISGTYLIVGARSESSDGSGGTTALDSGAAYIFEQPEIITYIPTTLTFSNNILTIDNVTSTTDTDVIDFVLPAGYNIPELNVTNFEGTGNVSYTLTTGGNTITSGTFSAASTNILNPGIPLFCISADTTYLLTITADALIGYSIVGTRGVTNVADYSIITLFTGGYTEQNMIDAGKWDADSNANHFNSTYNDGFLDISGNVTVTGNILMDAGDIDLHSHTFTDPYALSSDPYINNRLFVDGNVSMGDSFFEYRG